MDFMAIVANCGQEPFEFRHTLCDLQAVWGPPLNSRTASNRQTFQAQRNDFKIGGDQYLNAVNAINHIFLHETILFSKSWLNGQILPNRPDIFRRTWGQGTREEPPFPQGQKSALWHLLAIFCCFITTIRCRLMTLAARSSQATH